MDNLVLRGKTYHFVRRVPRDVQAVVGKAVWKVSLKTSNLREAEAKARRVGVELDEIFLAHRTSSPAAKLASAQIAAQRRYYEAVMAQEHAARRGDFDSSYGETVVTRGVAFNEATAALVAAKEKAVPNAETLLRALKDVEGQRIADAVTQAAYAGKPPPVDVQGWEKNFYSYRLQDDAKTQKETLRKLEVEAATRPIVERQLREDLKPLEGFVPLTDDPNNPRIGKAKSIWFSSRQQGECARKRHTVAVNRFVELHGDIPIGEITRPMVEKYVETIGQLTDHRHIPAKQRGGLLILPDLPKVAAPTVNRHIVSMKALLNFAVEKGWAKTNSAMGIRPPKDTRPKASKRRSFTMEERRTVLARAVEEYGEGSDWYWFIKLAAYTGGRLEELAQLSKDNVRTIDGVAAIEIDDLNGRKVKTESSVRTVPLHPDIAEGFLKFAAASTSRHSTVFGFRPDAKTRRHADVLSSEFGRLMDRAGLTDRRLVFHSFRHGLKKEMSDARVDPDARRLILGHTGRDAHDGYESFGLAALATEISRVPPLF